MSKTFIPRLTAPETDNPCYRTTESGGYNPCIDRGDGSVLPNCIGHVCGRLLETLGEVEGKKAARSCNAEDAIYCLKYRELSKTPVVGSVMCWTQGANFNGADGYGHVAFVEKVISPT